MSKIVFDDGRSVELSTETEQKLRDELLKPKEVKVDEFVAIKDRDTSNVYIGIKYGWDGVFNPDTQHYPKGQFWCMTKNHIKQIITGLADLIDVKINLED